MLRDSGSGEFKIPGHLLARAPNSNQPSLVLSCRLKGLQKLDCRLLVLCFLQQVSLPLCVAHMQSLSSPTPWALGNLDLGRDLAESPHGYFSQLDYDFFFLGGGCPIECGTLFIRTKEDPSSEKCEQLVLK